MRLISASVRNYRVHTHCAVEFDPASTLIGGPNESGKSTLIEAIHRAFFLRSKITGEVRDKMVSLFGAGHPEVEVEFMVGHERYRVLKKFAGGVGTTQLMQIGGATLHGEEAESRLAHLLSAEAIGGRGADDRLREQWGHLWVWQGRSGHDPMGAASVQRDALLQQLQNLGGAAALQSELDGQVAAQFQQAAAGLQGAGGKPKAQSAWGKAEAAAAEARQKLSLAEQRLSTRQQAVRDYDAAGRVLVDTKRDLEGLRAQFANAKARETALQQLRQEEVAQAADAAAKQQLREDLEKIHRQMTGLEQEIARLTESLAPLNQEVQRCAVAWDSAKQNASDAVQAHEAATVVARQRRLSSELAAAIVSTFERRTRLDELVRQSEKVQAHEKETQRLLQELAKIPELDAAKLKKLRKLESDSALADAALQAMAMTLRVVAADRDITVEGQPLKTGESTVLTEEAEVVVGATRLKLSPGGGTSLADARKAARDAREALTRALDAAGVATVASATDVVAKRDALSLQIKEVEAALKALSAEEIAEKLAEAQRANVATEADVQRRRAGLGEAGALPQSFAAAQQAASEAASALEAAELVETRAKASRGVAERRAAEADAQLTQARDRTARHQRLLEESASQSRLLVGNHGTVEEVVARLVKATTDFDIARATLEQTRGKIADLQPEHIARDLDRLTRAIAQLETAQNEAVTKRAVAEASLQSDGAEDPQQERELASARLRFAEDQLMAAKRQAQATLLLAQLFTEEQKQLAHQFTRPLAEKVGGYLQCIFGARAQARVTLQESGFSGLEIIRPDDGGAALPFDSLSGGAKEQVAAAVRLAVAEVLAADQDGTLPVVFDDAFAYSDPERVQELQRMLDLAATRGLQVIVLTCNPSDYAAFGGTRVTLKATKHLTLSPEARKLGVEDLTVTRDGEPSEILSSENVTEEQRLRFLSELQASGGSAGNLRLRTALGWEPEVYDAVRQELVAARLIALGRGKGGSVQLVPS